MSSAGSSSFFAVASRSVAGRGMPSFSQKLSKTLLTCSARSKSRFAMWPRTARMRSESCCCRPSSFLSTAPFFPSSALGEASAAGVAFASVAAFFGVPLASLSSAGLASAEDLLGVPLASAANFFGVALPGFASGVSTSMASLFAAARCRAGASTSVPPAWPRFFCARAPRAFFLPFFGATLSGVSSASPGFPSFNGVSTATDAFAPNRLLMASPIGLFESGAGGAGERPPQTLGSKSLSDKEAFSSHGPAVLPRSFNHICNWRTAAE
mmetsp:Transcript_47957/g.138061  ORF Transcript_47957/g.138061 Transcript_47957/m.138061 type:complete len:268 (-) Transcript_47957:430-1233(-)